MKGLSLRQRDILLFIQQFIDTHRYSPSYREIMHHFGFTSPGSVYKHIQTLQRKGLLTFEKQCSRSLMPAASTAISNIKQEVELPLIGHIMAGYPIEMFIQSQTIAVPTSLVHNPDNTYILRVQGESFHEELIQDGDLLLVEARSNVQAGETIVGLINQHDTIIKRYFPEGHYIRLESTHSHQQPLTLRHEHLSIQGILTGLMRVF